MIGRVEGHRDCSRNHLRRGYGGQEERKGRKELNHEIHENGRARWSHRNPLSFVVRPPSSVLRPPSSVHPLANNQFQPCRTCRGFWTGLTGLTGLRSGVCGVVGGKMVIELLAGKMRLVRGGIAAVECSSMGAGSIGGKNTVAIYCGNQV